MDIEQYLQASLAKPKDLQEHFGEGTEVNSQEPLLETHADGALDTFDLEEKKLPTEISLMVSVVAENLGDVMPGYAMSFVSKGAVCEPLPLGEIPGGVVPVCCAGLDLQWQGEGSQRGEYGTVDDLCEEVLELPRGVLFRKAFNLPPGAGFLCEEIYDQGLWSFGCPSWQTPRVDERPLIPFGGYMAPGLDPEKIMPLYAQVGGGETTTVLVKSQNFWQRLGVYPGTRGRKDSTFLSLIPLPEAYVVTSLAQDIRSGAIEIGNDEARYASHSYDVIEGDGRTLLIHFKQI